MTSNNRGECGSAGLVAVLPAGGFFRVAKQVTIYNRTADRASWP